MTTTEPNETSPALTVPPCPKCGHGDVRVHYHALRRHLADCEGIMSDWINRQRSEHLHCVCERCGYDWPIRTLDAPVTEPAP